MSPNIHIGCGSATPEDPIRLAADVADRTAVTYLGFDRLAERTLALAQVRRASEPTAGQDPRIGAVIQALSGFLGRGGRIVGSFGMANLDAATGDFVRGLRDAGYAGKKLGIVHGDDVLDVVRSTNAELPELGCTVGDLGSQVVSANAYIGADGIVELLGRGAQCVIGGRLADSSVFAAPICYEMGWALDDWDRVATAVMVAHLLECGVHVTGANFADPPYRIVPDGHDLGQPYAEVSDDEIIISKTPGTGGLVTPLTVKMQLGYEIHDPGAYLTPDISADFRNVEVEDAGPDRVRVRGARGSQRPDQLKVLVGVDFGWKAVGEISFGGSGCVERARIAEETIRRRLETLGDDVIELVVQLHGIDAVAGTVKQTYEPSDVRLRVAALSRTKEAAETVAFEAFWLYLGPSAGAAGATQSVVRAIGVTGAFVPRSSVPVECELVVA
jgi:Acyclic terpene utilisation family protein AtuA